MCAKQTPYHWAIASPLVKTFLGFIIYVNQCALSHCLGGRTQPSKSLHCWAISSVSPPLPLLNFLVMDYTAGYHSEVHSLEALSPHSLCTVPISNRQSTTFINCTVPFSILPAPTSGYYSHVAATPFYCLFVDGIWQSLVNGFIQYFLLHVRLISHSTAFSRFTQKLLKISKWCYLLTS